MKCFQARNWMQVHPPAVDTFIYVARGTTAGAADACDCGAQRYSVLRQMWESLTTTAARDTYASLSIVNPSPCHMQWYGGERGKEERLWGMCELEGPDALSGDVTAVNWLAGPTVCEKKEATSATEIQSGGPYMHTILRT